MKKALLLILVLCFGSLTSFAQEKLVANAYNRNSTSLNGDWQYIVDPYENGYYNYRYEAFDQQESPSPEGYFMNAKAKDVTDRVEYDYDQMPTLKVPGDWTSQDPTLLYYEGTLWYKKSFDFNFSKDGNRLFLYFGAANYKAEVYLNGKKLGTHVGGFTPFNFEVTDIVREKDNFVVVKVDNKRLKEGVPTLNTDWWNFGGLTRDVKLIETAANYIQDYFIQLDPENDKVIKGYVQLNGEDIAAKEVSIQIPYLIKNEQFITDKSGRIDFEIKANEIKYWSDDSPLLYEVTIITEEEETTDQIGFRTIKTKGSQILLNGEPVFLRGISIHEESPHRMGRANSIEDAVQLLEWARELGCNFVRLAHYPHNEHMVRMADKMGILVWEENPVYWTIAWDNPETYANAENQLSEVIERDKNRASVIIWSMSNETPNSDARYKFLKSLADYTRAHDNTRLISSALEQTSIKGQPFVRTIDDPFAKDVDILSFNEYIGWYDGLPDKCAKISWKIDQDKPVLISEFGAGAKQGLLGEDNERWTEDFQEDLYEQTLKMLDKIDQLQGLSPWILVDFRSPRRVHPTLQEGWNRKGLISDDGIKKKAFSTLRKYYDEKMPQNDR